MLNIDVYDIKEVLPQRYPFLFIDKITDVKFMRWARGYKNVSWNEWFFPFEDRTAQMPEMLIVEALAQLGAFAVHGPELLDKVGLITKIEDIEFIGPVKPGDRLDMYFEVTRLKSRLMVGHGYASVDGKTVLRIGSCGVYYVDDTYGIFENHSFGSVGKNA